MNSKSVLRQARLAIHSVFLVPTLMYDSESWVWQKKNESRINAVERRSLRSMCGMSRKDRCRNSDVRQRCALKEDVTRRGASTSPERAVPALRRSQNSFARSAPDIGPTIIIYGNTSIVLCTVTVYDDTLMVNKYASDDVKITSVPMLMKKTRSRGFSNVVCIKREIHQKKYTRKMSKKLYYFDIKGLAESSRYILHYGGVEFEDVRIPRSEWPSKKDEISPPFGKLPIFVDGDRVLNQSVAIARYIGRGLDLVPSDPWEEAAVDAVILTLQDLSASFSALFREQDETKKAALKKELVEETMPFYFSKFDKMLKENKGHFGKKLTWADFVFASNLDLIEEHLQAKILENYPNIKALISKIQNLPGVKDCNALRHITPPSIVYVIFTQEVGNAPATRPLSMDGGGQLLFGGSHAVYPSPWALATPEESPSEIGLTEMGEGEWVTGTRIHWSKDNCESCWFMPVFCLGESLKYILHYGGIEFEDVRIPYSEWSTKKHEVPSPFGKLPVLVEGDRILNQSIAIARYLGRGLDLVPADPWEEATVDAVILTLNDLMTIVSAFVHEQEEVKKETLKKGLIEESVPFYFTRFEKILEQNNGHVGAKLTWADFVFVGVVELIEVYVQDNILEKYSAVKGLMNTVQNLAGVKEYIANRKV
ncbi:Glutathione S-transferase [Eumeta japonica]|uniref:glutathione transferase n=1 Tax=Eumeta variegata TaxID=151549 RepID=A0A4C1YRD1_EUMVA|nr:Glutathione S-transferase [Eumeta japonica]